ncbi:Spermidine synthase [Halotydeus destructor]|nr:Spermidine synthase [Halotydeus destructor]
MNTFQKGWFTETGVLNKDFVTCSVKVEKVLHEETSKYQRLLVFDSAIYGRCLVLDDAIQCTEKDEFAYQEMISFLPLNSHPCPKRVLIIGGGDGGVAREVCKHPSVEKVVQCEIDEAVVRVSKQFLPFMACGFDSPKLELIIDDGYKYVLDHKEDFDVIITDSSDPLGPAKCLFEKPYYQALFESLRPGGIICCQGETYWFDLEFIKDLFRTCKTIFSTVAYASSAVPSYPSGQIGYLLCCKDQIIDMANPVHKFTDDQVKSMNLRYYSEEMHRASFVLPNYVKEQFDNL